MELIYKKLCIYSYMFKPQSPSKYSPLDAMHLLKHFFPLLKTGFELIHFDAFQCLCHFLVHLFYTGKMIPFKDFFFIRGNKIKGTLGETGGIGRVGHGGHAVFGQKLLNTQCGVSRCAHESPIVKWANTLKESSKNFF